jgi:hypothetical protein
MVNGQLRQHGSVNGVTEGFIAAAAKASKSPHTALYSVTLL